MVIEWRFDENNPYEDAFDESLLPLLTYRQVLNVVLRKLELIQKEPKAQFRGMVRGRMVYVAFTGPGYVGDGGYAIEPMIIVYTLDERRHLIQRMFVGAASECVDDPWGKTMKSITPTLRDAIARAMGQRRQIA